MKKLLLGGAASLFATVLPAQNPVHWNYTLQKIANNTFEVRLRATIDPSWHIYSQLQPEDAIALPTKISFKANALLRLQGKPRELGKLEKYTDENLGISANQYSGGVEFVQDIILKAKARTNVSGNIEYQACTDERCLLPKTVSFSLKL